MTSSVANSFSLACLLCVVLDITLSVSSLTTQRNFSIKTGRGPSPMHVARKVFPRLALLTSLGQISVASWGLFIPGYSFARVGGVGLDG